MLWRPRTSSQHATRGGHSDDDEDEGVPASYHTVSLQVSQDVSIDPLLLPLLSLHLTLGACTRIGTARAERERPSFPEALSHSPQCSHIQATYKFA